MKMTKTNIILIISLLCFTVSACKKLDYEGMEVVQFGKVFFYANNVKTPLQIRTKNNNPVIWRQDGLISAPEGEVTFEFYNKNNGETLLEKTVNIVNNKVEHFTLFQPTLESPLIFLDENAQANEEAAPEGFFKIKLVDYTGGLFFGKDKKMDIVMFRSEFSWETWQTEYVEIGILENIGSNLDEEGYHLIPIQPADGNMAFSYREAGTGKKLITVEGKEFINTTIYNGLIDASNSLSNPKKHVFTAYLSSFVIDYQNDSYVKINNKLYDIHSSIFLKN